MPRVLMIAFHFPPAAMGSGHLRTLGFVRHLPASGWEPMVLSAWPCAYPRTHPDNEALIPASCRVHRAPALDVRRHLSIAGRYPGFLAQPDGWASWWPAAVWQGMRLIRRHRIDVIWSTYPIMTAHAVAHTLSRLSGLPWVADFRDPVATSVETGNRHSVASQRRWEKRAIDRARALVFTTPGARSAYAVRMPATGTGQALHVIANGYEESAFQTLVDVPPPVEGRPLRLVHAGILYRDGRDPLPLFVALSRLRAARVLDERHLRVVLRASGSEAVYREAIQRLDIAAMVELAPPVSSRDALVEQAGADALLLFQGSRFNRQIPAKVYEYLRVGRPILGLVDLGGDTARLLQDSGGARLLSMDDAGAIERHLPAFVEAVRAGATPPADPAVVAGLSRERGASVLAGVLDAAVATRRA